MQPWDLKLDHVLRRAMARADIVLSYRHLCRRKGCCFKVQKPTPEPGRCPDCEMRLWPVAIPRHVRFHDLCHTTAMLVLKEGVPLAVVQRILRHSDPRLTAMIYGHLDLTDMRAGLEKLRFSDEKSRPHGAPVVRRSASRKKKAAAPRKRPQKPRPSNSRGDRIRTCDPLVPKGVRRVSTR
jgi:hypothetical protein